MTSWGEMTHLAGVRPECLPDLADERSQGLMERMKVLLGFSTAAACGHPDCLACHE